MSTTSKSFTAVGVGDAATLKRGESLTYDLSGTFVGTLYVETSRNGGASWERAITALTAAGSGTIKNDQVSELRVRWRMSARTSGTAVTTLVDASDTVQEFKHPLTGEVLLRFTDTGVEVPGTLSVTGAVSTAAAATTSAGVGAKAGSTVTVVEQGNEVLHRTVLTLTATPVTITDDPGVAQYGGTGKIYDFPEGLICTLGAVVDGALTLGTTGTIINTYTGVMALGTATAGTGATLTLTEADVLQSTALTQAVAKVATSDAVSIATALTEAGSRWLDGTVTAKDLFLNFAIADDASHTSGTGTFTGTITLLWTNIGDKS